MSISYSWPRSWKVFAASPLPHHFVPGHVLGNWNWKFEKIVVDAEVVVSVTFVVVSVLLRTVRVLLSTSSHWDMSLFICANVISNGRLILLNCFSSCSPSSSLLEWTEEVLKSSYFSFAVLWCFVVKLGQ